MLGLGHKETIRQILVDLPNNDWLDEMIVFLLTGSLHHTGYLLLTVRKALQTVVSQAYLNLLQDSTNVACAC
jgi:hypothetical protein